MVMRMPLLRCTDEECGHEFFRATHLAEGCECEECGEATKSVGVDDDVPAELQAASQQVDLGGPRSAHARARARATLAKYKIAAPPIPVQDIARSEGFAVRISSSLGGLRARLVDDQIEVNSNEPRVAHRFSIAHELGHHFLGTGHGNDRAVEREADAFAGELLIPGVMLSSAMATETNVRALARQFDVSRRALEVAADIHKLGDQLS